MPDGNTTYEILRPAGTSERRCIMRHTLGYYRALIVSGRYTTPNEFFAEKESFYPALKHCISTHPMLSVTVKGEETEAPELIRPATLDLSNHVDILQPITVTGAGIHAELEALRPRLCHAHDELFPDVERIPPWKILVVPINNATIYQACWIFFSYSHSHGDGRSGLAFHRTLLHALRDPSITTSPPSSSPSTDDDPIFTPPSQPLLPPVELARPFPITWSFLLLPVISAYLPASIASLLPTLFRASVTPQAPDAWTARPTSFAPDAFHTGLRFAVADAPTVRALLQRCRAHAGVRLTGVLHNLVVRALSAALPPTRAGTFVAQTATDLKRLMPEEWQGAFGLGVSVAYHAFPRTTGAAAETEGFDDDDAFWETARATTAHLAERVATLVDQPIGLLRYLRNFRSWLEGMIGKERDASYEISNITVFDPEEGEDGGRMPGGSEWKVGRVVFSQPANAVGSPVSFNVVTTKNGDMVISLTWQKGVLGMDQDEDEWAKGVCGHLERDMKTLAEGK